MRRAAGIGAIKKKEVAQNRYADKGYELAENELQELSRFVTKFKEHLELFSSKYKNDIRKNSQFRKQFQDLCAHIGVDPLASSKGFWSEMLGVGDFYYELAVQIVEVCMATRERNGGLITLDELMHRLLASRSKHAQQISRDDVICAIKKVQPLGTGFTLIPLAGGSFLIQSVPGELSMDHAAVIQIAEEVGFVSVSILKEKLKWTADRAERILDHLTREGMVWVDAQSAEKNYYFPSLSTRES